MKTLLNPQGATDRLYGYRLASKALADVNLTGMASEGILGNMVPVTIMWSEIEGDPCQPGVYDTDYEDEKIEEMEQIAQAGLWVVPSIRLGYDDTDAVWLTENGVSCFHGASVDWPDGDVDVNVGPAPDGSGDITRTLRKLGWGWAEHWRILQNDQVAVLYGANAGVYGNYRDRCFAWYEHFIQKLLANAVVAPKIAYWQTWHNPGHRNVRLNDYTVAWEFFYEDFWPRLLKLFRTHDRHRMLSLSVSINSVNAWGSTSQPTWKDRNVILHSGMYCQHDALVENEPVANPGPSSDASVDIPACTADFSPLGPAVRDPDTLFVFQETGGMMAAHRYTPLPGYQRRVLIKVVNSLNERGHGFGHHSMPPRIDATNLYMAGIQIPTHGSDDEFLAIMAKAMSNERVEFPDQGITNWWYVDPVREETAGFRLYYTGVLGSDTNLGTHPHFAFATIAPINALSPIAKGTMIHLLGGQTYDGLDIDCSAATADEPIIITAYGSGAFTLTNETIVSNEHVQIITDAANCPVVGS